VEKFLAGAGNRRAARDTDALRTYFSNGDTVKGQWRLIGLL
jgi:hypothetical protein